MSKGPKTKYSAVVFHADVTYDQRESPTSQFVLRAGQRPNLVINDRYYSFEVVGDEGEITFGESGVIVGRAVTTVALEPEFSIGTKLELRSARQPMCQGTITKIESVTALPD